MTAVESDQPLAAVQSPAVVRRESLILRVYVVLLIGMIGLQMVGVPTGGNPIQVVLPLTWLSVAFLYTRGAVRVDVPGLLLYLAFASLMILSNNILNEHAGETKVTSMMIVLSTYALFVFRVPVSRETLLKMSNIFIVGMLIFAPVILIQWALQFVIHPGLWGDLSGVIPHNMLIIFNYVHRIFWWSAWIQPNGVVFLEVSILSQFLTLAVLLELSLFQRARVLLILGASMLATLAASGPFMLVLCAPLIALRAPRRLILPLIFAGAAVLILGMTTGVFDVLFSRVGEVGTSNTSGYVRLVVPIQAMWEYLSSGQAGLFTGLGAGAGDGLGTALAVSKLLVEYGILPMIAFTLLFTYTVLRAGRPPLFTWGIFVFYNLMGGYLAVPSCALAALIFCAMFVVAPAAATWRAAPQRFGARRLAAAAEAPSRGPGEPLLAD